LTDDPSENPKRAIPYDKKQRSFLLRYDPSDDPDETAQYDQTQQRAEGNPL
jgi:hypothetical protein